MGLDLRPDRMGSLVSSGIPGARSQPPLRQKAPKLKSSPRSGSSRSRRQAMRLLSCQLLNQLLADSMVLYDHYKKYHWLLRDHAFCQLHIVLDKHAGEQRELIDLIVERVRTLGGVATVPRQVAALTVIARPSNDAEEVVGMLSRLLEAHELIIVRVREAITAIAASRDDGTTSDLLSNMLRRHELQVSIIAEHLVDAASLCA
jgi:starvation-inducible DNA-binding protein